MADNNFGIIRPVESLNNVTNVGSIQQRDKRKKDQQENKEKSDASENEHHIEEDISMEIDENSDEKHIDFKA